MSKNGCDCFACRNSDNNDRLYGYHYASYEVYRMIAAELRQLGFTPTTVDDYSIGGLLACCDYNRDCAGALLKEIENELKEK